MSSPQKVYTEEFKREAVRLSDESGLGIASPGNDEPVSVLLWCYQFFLRNVVAGHRERLDSQ